MNKAPEQTVNDNSANQQKKEQSRPKNPYSPPTTTKPNATNSPAGKHHLAHSPPTFLPFSPPFSNFSASPYSPASPSATSKHISSVTPSKIPAQPIISASQMVTPARSFNPNFNYPNSNSNSTAGHTPYNPEVKSKLDFGPPKK